MRYTHQTDQHKISERLLPYPTVLCRWAQDRGHSQVTLGQRRGNGFLRSPYCSSSALLLVFFAQCRKFGLLQPTALLQLLLVMVCSAADVSAKEVILFHVPEKTQDFHALKLLHPHCTLKHTKCLTYKNSAI